MDQIVLAQLSDSHIGGQGPNHKGIDTAARLSTAVDWILKCSLPIQGCLITGDLVDRGSLREYQRLREILDPLRRQMPIYLVLGNHDGRDAFLQVFGDYPGAEECRTRPFVQYSQSLLEGHRLIVLDSLEPGEDGGRLCPARLDWLSRTLSDHAQDRILLAVHHPPIPCGNPLFDRMGLADSEALRAVCERHGGVELIVSGHVHRSISSSLSGIPVRVGPSTAYPYAIDYAHDRRGDPQSEPPGLAIHRLLGQPAAWATHTVLLPNTKDS